MSVRGWIFAALLVLAPVLRAEPPPDEPRPAVLRDRDFGVSSEGFGLDRRVEMYQWVQSDGSFQEVWNEALIDASSFPPEYRNPDRLPIEGKRWWADSATLDGKPLDREVLYALGRWEAFRPDFSRLPANLAASFQPEGDGLGSSDDPAAPQVGDLRIRWRRLVLPTLAGRVVLRDGRWQLTPQAAAQPIAPDDPAVDVSGTDEVFAQRWWPWLVAATFAILLGFVLFRRAWYRRRR